MKRKNIRTITSRKRATTIGTSRQLNNQQDRISQGSRSLQPAIPPALHSATCRPKSRSPKSLSSSAWCPKRTCSPSACSSQTTKSSSLPRPNAARKATSSTSTAPLAEARTPHEDTRPMRTGHRPSSTSPCRSFRTVVQQSWNPIHSSTCQLSVRAPKSRN